MEKANLELRRKMKDAELPIWTVAREIGICEVTLVKWLRTPLSIEQSKKITDAISKLELAKEEKR